MASTSETGHAKNIANLKRLIQLLTGLGSIYNPINTNILITALQTIYDNAFAQQNAVITQKAPYTTAVANRQALFNPLNRFITKLRKVYKTVQDITPAQLENFMTIARKIKGDRKTPPPPTGTDGSSASHSVAQLSFDQRTNSMQQMVTLLENTTNYNPNENEYKTATLTATQQQMLDSTETVDDTFVPYNTALSTRNQTMYTATNNLVDSCYAAKDYCFTILDTDSEEYKAIARLKFTRK
jgi:hypothetical protein